MKAKREKEIRRSIDKGLTSKKWEIETLRNGK